MTWSNNLGCLKVEA